MFEQVAGDAATPRSDRIAALRGLGQLANPDAEQLLLAHATDAAADPRVRQEALAALGGFASRAALDILAGLGDPGDEAARRQLALARALIAHREGIDRELLPDVEGSRRERQVAPAERAVSLEPASAEAADEDAERFRGPDFGVALAKRSYRLRCGRAQWSLFVHRELGGPEPAWGRLLDRPWIAALLARWAPPARAITTQYVVLTRPAGESARVDVVRTDGVIAYTGSARPDGAELAFSITDVDRPQTVPTNLAGDLAPDRVRLETAAVAAGRVGRRPTEPTRPEPG